ncbi:unnamed protein product [Schistosoma turkestanicum]|nr:unnamed protein product [Schistosoma turkestanicum]
MHSIRCDAVLAYREECTIYEDVCILSSYGTAVQLNPNWMNNYSLQKITTTNSLSCISANLEKASEKIRASVSTSSHFTTNDQCPTKIPSTHCSPELTTTNHSFRMSSSSSSSSSSETTPVPSPTSSYNKQLRKEYTADQCLLPHKQIFHHVNNAVKPNCRICHLPTISDTNPNQFTSPVTSSRCASCKMASVPDLLFSSSDFPAELLIIGNPALIQARVCRTKKDTKGEVAASELSEILPFIDYELHYRLMQKLRLRSMNGLFGLRYRIAIGEYMIAAIADTYYQNNLPTKLDKSIITDNKQHTNEIHCNNPMKSSMDNQFNQLNINNNHNNNNTIMINHFKDSHPSFKQSTCDLIHSHHTDDTLFLETREPEIEELAILLQDPFQPQEIEELAILLQDPFQPQGLILTTTESIPISSNNHNDQNNSNNNNNNNVDDDNVTLNSNSNNNNTDSKMFIHSNKLSAWHYQSNSFIRLHETQLTVPDSFFETSMNSANCPNPMVFSSSSCVNELTPTTTTTTALTLTPQSHSVSTQNLIHCHTTGLDLNLPRTTTCSIKNDSIKTTRIAIITSSTNTITSSTSTSTSSTSSSTSLNSSMPNVKMKHSSQYHQTLLYNNNNININNSMNEHSLSKALREFNQLTWFRFRHYIPCIINALDYRLSFTDDEHIQIIATGMILHPIHSSSLIQTNENQQSMFNVQSTPNSPVAAANPDNHSSTSQNKFTSHSMGDHYNANNDDDNASERKSSIKSRSKFHLRKPSLLTKLKTDLKSISFIKRTNDGIMLSNDENPSQQENHPQQPIDKPHTSNNCILTPLSSIPNACVEAYLGNLDFFFVRETTDLREVGGISGFLHTSLTEVQAVVGAHTTSLGGNALLSYHLSEVVVLRPTSRNQAQCLLNVCGDMARLSWSTTTTKHRQFTKCKSQV